MEKLKIRCFLFDAVKAGQGGTVSHRVFGCWAWGVALLLPLTKIKTSLN